MTIVPHEERVEEKEIGWNDKSEFSDKAEETTMKRLDEGIENCARKST